MLDLWFSEFHAPDAKLSILSADQGLFASPRSFSQLITSFFGS